MNSSSNKADICITELPDDILEKILYYLQTPGLGMNSRQIRESLRFCSFAMCSSKILKLVSKTFSRDMRVIDARIEAFHPDQPGPTILCSSYTHEHLKSIRTVRKVPQLAKALSILPKIAGRNLKELYFTHFLTKGETYEIIKCIAEQSTELKKLYILDNGHISECGFKHLRLIKSLVELTVLYPSKSFILMLGTQCFPNLKILELYSIHRSILIDFCESFVTISDSKIVEKQNLKKPLDLLHISVCSCPHSNKTDLGGFSSLKKFAIENLKSNEITINRLSIETKRLREYHDMLQDVEQIVQDRTQFASVLEVYCKDKNIVIPRYCISPRSPWSSVSINKVVLHAMDNDIQFFRNELQRYQVLSLRLIPVNYFNKFINDIDYEEYRKTFIEFSRFSIINLHRVSSFDIAVQILKWTSGSVSVVLIDWRQVMAFDQESFEYGMSNLIQQCGSVKVIGIIPTLSVDFASEEPVLETIISRICFILEEVSKYCPKLLNFFIHTQVNPVSLRDIAKVLIYAKLTLDVVEIKIPRLDLVSVKTFINKLIMNMDRAGSVQNNIWRA